MYLGHGLFEVYFKLSKLPERYYKGQNIYIDDEGRQIKSTHMSRVKSEIWNESIFINCLQSQYTIKIKGYIPETTYSEFVKRANLKEKSKKKLSNYLILELLKKELRGRFKEKPPSYCWIGKEAQEIAQRNLLLGIKKIENLLIKLPFPVHYAFL